MCHKESCYFGFILKNYFINKRLIDLGIETKYTAFYYLSDIMYQLINENVFIQSFSKQVYPKLAEKYNKNDCTIERDIRNLIAIKWEQSLKAKLSKYWIESEPPSCCKFIRIIKNYLVDQFV